MMSADRKSNHFAVCSWNRNYKDSTIAERLRDNRWKYTTNLNATITETTEETFTSRLISQDTFIHSISTKNRFYGFDVNRSYKEHIGRRFCIALMQKYMRLKNFQCSMSLQEYFSLWNESMMTAKSKKCDAMLSMKDMPLGIQWTKRFAICTKNTQIKCRDNESQMKSIAHKLYAKNTFVLQLYTCFEWLVFISHIFVLGFCAKVRKTFFSHNEMSSGMLFSCDRHDSDMFDIFRQLFNVLSHQFFLFFVLFQLDATGFTRFRFTKLHTLIFK